MMQLIKVVYNLTKNNLIKNSNYIRVFWSISGEETGAMAARSNPARVPLKGWVIF
jgi:hypothetical protein